MHPLITRILPGIILLSSMLFLVMGMARAEQDAVVVDKDAVNITSRLKVTGSAAADSFFGKGAVPVGAILMWSGRPDQLPPGWVLCDGRALPGGNKTPNLSGRFIVGYEAGNAEYAVNNSGGEARHTLTVEEMPRHDHPANMNRAGTHEHTFRISQHGWAFALAQSGDEHSGPISTAPTSSAGDHIHTVTVQPKGDGKAHENRPPYYVLAYILYTGQ
jgi:microcystin-dependent protein